MKKNYFIYLSAIAAVSLLCHKTLAQSDFLLDCFQNAQAINSGAQARLPDLDACNQAIAYFENSISQNNAGYSDLERSAVYQNRAIILTELTEFQKASDDLNQALAISPNSLELRLNIGVLYMLRGEYFAAIENFSALLLREQNLAQAGELLTEVDELFAQALYNRALAYNYSGDIERAVSDLFTLQLEHSRYYNAWVSEEALPTLFPLLPELLVTPEDNSPTSISR